jgi:cation/acetate symporter
MSQYVLNLLVVGASFALYIGIAIWARAGSTSEFYAANRGVNPVMNGMATGADWMSAASFISMAGLISTVGYVNSSYLMGWTGGYVLLALLLAPYLRKFGKFTVPEFIGDRFYSTTARLVAIVCLIIISVTYVIGQMTGAGVAFSRFLEVDVTTGLLIGAAVVFMYAVLGGMKGITYTQVAQYVVLIVAYTIPAIFISLQLTGQRAPAARPLLRAHRLRPAAPEPARPGGAGPGLRRLTRDVGLHAQHVPLHPVADDRHRGPAARHHPLLHRAQGVGRPPVGRLVAGVHRAPVPDRARGRRHGAAQPPLHRLSRGPRRRGAGLRGAAGLDAKLGSHRPPHLRGQERRRPHPALQRRQRRLRRDRAERGWAGQRAHGEQRHHRARQPRDRRAFRAGSSRSSPRAASRRRSRRPAGLLLAISSAISHDLIKRTLNPGISEKGELLAARISMAVAIVVATWLGSTRPASRRRPWPWPSASRRPRSSRR